MAEIRISPEAEAEIDDIWLYLARESGSIDLANRIVDRIAQRFQLLTQYTHTSGARETKTCTRACEALQRTDTLSFTKSKTIRC